MLCFKRRLLSRRCTLLLIAWSTLAVVLLYMRASRNANKVKIPHQSFSADTLISYFHWPILDVVQLTKVYPDGKQFVDMVLKRPLEEIVQDFTIRGLSVKSSKEDIVKFLEENYLPAGSDVEPIRPIDWRADAVEALAKTIANKEPSMTNWILALHRLWRNLARIPAPVALVNYPRASSLVVPDGMESNWFIVPGGRFRELYYWDAYWTMRGLAVSGMHRTMNSMLTIMLAFVTELGYVPNCNRVYCLNRSQPPMLCLMVEAYLKASNDQSFLRENFHLLEREYNWWMSERTGTVLVQYKYSYALNHYGASAIRARPESYREDLATAGSPKAGGGGGGVGAGGNSEHLYAELAAACESGVDFSSRWLSQPSRLASIETSQILPVDLNAIMYRNERLLSDWATQLGYRDKTHLYADSADMRLRAMERLLWNETAGCWFDFHVERQAPVNSRFYASNLVPLFAGAIHKPEITLPRVLDYLDASGALAFPGGVPYSLEKGSVQQWDFPNVWPPFQHMLVTGLAQQSATADPSGRARSMAKRLAGTWLRSQHAAWLKSRRDRGDAGNKDGAMPEKADARTPGEAGGSGEYGSQVGFGWTNGAVLDLLSQGLL